VTTSRASARHCKDCLADLAVRAYGETIPVKLRPAPHPGPRCATHHRVEALRRKKAAQERRREQVYGITAADHAALLALQGGKCAICQKATGARRALAVDHDHAQARLDGHDEDKGCPRCVRGLCCKRCNRILGDLRDDPETFQRAADYLRNWPMSRVRSASATNGSGSTGPAGSSASGAAAKASSGPTT
jgi:hypothetical protein